MVRQNEPTVRSDDPLKYGLQDAGGVRLIAGVRARGSDVVVRDHVMDEEWNDDGESAADYTGGKASALSDAVDEAGAGSTVFNCSGIGLGVALRPLFDEAAHSIALKVLDEGADTAALLKFFHEAASNFRVFGRSVTHGHGFNGIENAH
jgi:hypothetical protein